jgi:hypothetical protein
MEQKQRILRKRSEPRDAVTVTNSRLGGPGTCIDPVDFPAAPLRLSDGLGNLESH